MRAGSNPTAAPRSTCVSSPPPIPTSGNTRTCPYFNVPGTHPCCRQNDQGVKKRRMVRSSGFEPPRYCYRQPLKLVRLPVPPRPLRINPKLRGFRLSNSARQKLKILVRSRNPRPVISWAADSAVQAVAPAARQVQERAISPAAAQPAWPAQEQIAAFAQGWIPSKQRQQARALRKASAKSS
jgi:hypothetical protein